MSLAPRITDPENVDQERGEDALDPPVSRMGGRDLFEHVDRRLRSTQTAVDRGYAKEDRDEVDRIPDKVRAGLVEAAVRLDRSASLDKGDRGALRLRCSIRVAQRGREIACRIPPKRTSKPASAACP